MFCSLWSAALSLPIPLPTVSSPSWLLKDPNTPNDHKALGMRKTIPSTLNFFLPFQYERNYNFIHISQRYVKKTPIISTFNFIVLQNAYLFD